MGEHTPLPWCIPSGENNAFIICAGDNPDKPGDILMVARAPAGRRTVATDHQVNANIALMVKCVNAHAGLVKALEWYAKGNNNWDRGKRAIAALASLSEGK